MEKFLRQYIPVVRVVFIIIWVGGWWKLYAL